MEACQGVEREVARITEKFDLLKHLSLRGLEDLVEAIKDAKEDLSRSQFRVHQLCSFGVFRNKHVLSFVSVLFSLEKVGAVLSTRRRT